MNIAYKQISVMRHAESLEDIDKTAYERISDEDIPLSKLGRDQSMVFGEKFAKSFKETREYVHIILSPSKRVLETAEIIVSKLPINVKWSLETDCHIVKQNWGNVTIHNRAIIEKERYQAGVLRYQFPSGENGVQMISRFKAFSEGLQQKISLKHRNNILIITHGFEMRVLLKCLLYWTDEYFESLAHPYNCEMKRITFVEEKLSLLDEMRKHDLATNKNFIKRIL